MSNDKIWQEYIEKNFDKFISSLKSDDFISGKKEIINDKDIDFLETKKTYDCLRKIIPAMSEEKAWDLANKIDRDGSAVVWRGPMEQAELYHQQFLLNISILPNHSDPCHLQLK